MSLIGQLFLQKTIADSLMPIAAKNEILAGRKPVINTNSIFLKSGEQCVYIDKAIYNENVKKRIYHHGGGSMPGLFKGHRMNYGTGTSSDYTEVKQHKGILYITTKRTIFQSSEKCFDKNHTVLTSIDPYTNAVVLQFGDKSYELIVPDGTVVNAVLRLVV